MRHVIFLILMFSTVVFTAKAIETYDGVIMANDWPEPPRAQPISQLPAVTTILNQFEENEHVSITIYYPGGVAGLNWAKQMYDWLVALGIPNQYVSLAVGSGGANQLRLQLVDRR